MRAGSMFRRQHDVNGTLSVCVALATDQIKSRAVASLPRENAPHRRLRAGVGRLALLLPVFLNHVPHLLDDCYANENTGE